MKHYLGIDGGGTKSTAAVADENGKIIGRVIGKSINFYAVGMEKCRENLREILAEIEEKYNIYQYTAAFIGCSALDGKAGKKTVADLCYGIVNADLIGMNSDAFVALKASNGNCVAICGTGSMAIGEKTTGETVVKGGWGHILGDEGSAYSIALAALKKCCVDFDKGERNPLVSAAEKYFNTENLRGIIDTVYSESMQKSFIAGFSTIAASLASQGDGSAKEIIKNEACLFSETVISLINELDCEPYLSVCGGVFEKNEWFKNVFCEEMRKAFPKITIDMLSITPEEGALKAAMELK